jgi:ectoine hydroxylase-related dioxygenase (phytanoyl-CoA dioxygenase family)
MNDSDLLAELAAEGICVVPDVLSPADLQRARDALADAVERSPRLGRPTYDPRLDPNASNLRVYHLPQFDPLFIELVHRPRAMQFVEAVLGPHVILSNFTANIALPGSGSMKWHADQALAVPGPWDEAWTVNAIWCLDDVHEANGATRFLPGSHRWRSRADVPADVLSGELDAASWRAFEAPAGSIVVMDGRLWHTSGENVTADERRRLMFAYYCRDFVRPTINWEAALSDEIKAGVVDEARTLLGLGVMANRRMSTVVLREPA